MTVLGWCGNDPGNGFAAEAWFTRQRQRRGDCPCCGDALADPRMIAEGVRVCGMCAEPGHVPGDPGWAGLLRALVSRQPPPWRPS